MVIGDCQNLIDGIAANRFKAGRPFVRVCNLH